MQHDPEFIRATFRLLLAMEEQHLGTPLHIGWVQGHEDLAPRLRVQVEDTDFADWSKALTDVVMETEPVEDHTHVHAHGILLHNEQVGVHLVAVTEAVAQ